MTQNKPTKTIELPEELYNAVFELRDVFRDVSQNKDLTEVDVVATLVAGFMDGMKQDAGGCCSGGNCGWCSGDCGCKH